MRRSIKQNQIVKDKKGIYYIALLNPNGEIGFYRQKDFMHCSIKIDKLYSVRKEYNYSVFFNGGTDLEYFLIEE